MRQLGINLAIGIVLAYVAYQLGAWRERRWRAGLEKRSAEFREQLRNFKKRESDK